MARNEGGPNRVFPKFVTKNSNGSKRNSHKRGLRIPRERERGLWAFPNGARELLAQRFVHFLKDCASHGKSARERLPHAGGLAALPWKCKCEGHTARVSLAS